MTPMGLSGAKVEIVGDVAIKTGKGAHAQAMYCMFLGKEVCPEILWTDLVKDEYGMERLDPLQPPHPEEVLPLIFMAQTVLEKTCWNRPLAGPEIQPFREPLVAWLRDYPWISSQLVYALYPEEPCFDELRVIHGDPTLANVLRRGAQMVIGDPIRPTGKIPSLIDVDRGKLLQSSLGWEWMINPSWPIVALVYREYLGSLRPDDRARACFWAAVHFARAIPYSQHVLVTEMATDMSKELTEMCGDYL